jgi:hypothetical protein
MEPTGPIIKAALALAALANSCQDVSGEPRCPELEALKVMGWKLSFTFDAKTETFHLIGRHK